MENSEIEVNEIVDRIIENLETSLGRLGDTLKINEIQEEKKATVVKQNKETVVEIQEKPSSTIKIPFASVRYPTPADNLIVKKKESKDPIEETPFTPIPQTNYAKPKVIDQSDYETKEIISKIHEESEIKTYESLETTEEEIVFLDIPKTARLIHLFGPPGSAKTTLGLQIAVEISPKKTYYFITSHATSVLKRVKQIVDDERWEEYSNFKQSFYPIEVSNLEVVISNLKKIEVLPSDEIGLIIIDHITDYIRGQIHKEESREQLRNLLEKLYLIADEKDCKVILVNGYSYKSSAPAEDIVESFCDLTFRTLVEDQEIILFAEEDQYQLLLDDSGVRNLHVNVYY